VKREQSVEDKDHLKKVTGKGVEEKIRQKMILREYVIVYFILQFKNERIRVFIGYTLLDQTQILKIKGKNYFHSEII
jgi:hypothetical protein